MTGPATPPTPPGDGPWVERWLSPERFATYLRAANGDRGRALALYEWNARVGAALLHDLGHLEIGLRNAYDRALSSGAASRGRTRTPPCSLRSFRPVPAGRSM